MAGQFSYGGNVFDDNSPWKNTYNMDGSITDVGKTQLFNYDDLLKGTYNYDDLINNVYRSDTGINNDAGNVNYTAWAPQNEFTGRPDGVLNGLGSVSGSGFTTSDKYLGNDQGAMSYSTSYSNPTSLFIDNKQNGSNTEGSNWNYNVTRGADGKAVATKVKRYEDEFDPAAGWQGYGKALLAGAAIYGGAAAMGGLATEGGAAAGGSLTGGGGFSGGGFGGYGGSIMDTGAFDLGGTFGGVEGAGGYSSGLADLFGGYGGDMATGAFDLGGSFGGVDGAGSVTGDYLSSGMQYMDPSMTGAFDMGGSEGAGMGFGGSDSSYGLSNLFNDARNYGGKLNDFNNITKQYTGQSVSQLGRGLYDAYAKNQISRSAGDRADTLSNLFGNDSPYAQQLAKTLAVRDAAAGRNSQYGPRSVELQAKLAELQAGVLNSKNYNDLRNTQNNAKLGMFNTLVANSAASAIAKATSPVVSSAISSVAKYIGF